MGRRSGERARPGRQCRRPAEKEQGMTTQGTSDGSGRVAGAAPWTLSIAPPPVVARSRSSASPPAGSTSPRTPSTRWARSTLAALSVASRGLPLMIPALGRGVRSDELLSQLDGLFLTGSPSNVEPHQYQAEVVDPEIVHDPHRDATTLPLIRRAVEIGVPLLAVCRGCQEMNVAFRGTLHQKVQEVGRADGPSRGPVPAPGGAVRAGARRATGAPAVCSRALPGATRSRSTPCTPRAWSASERACG